MSLGVHISAPKSSAKALVYRYSPSQLEPSPRVCGAEARRQLVPQAPGRTAVPPGALSAEKQAGGGGEGGGAGSGQGEGTEEGRASAGSAGRAACPGSRVRRPQPHQFGRPGRVRTGSQAQVLSLRSE